jgi:hypothetical protein
LKRRTFSFNDAGDQRRFRDLAREWIEWGVGRFTLVAERHEADIVLYFGEGGSGSGVAVPTAGVWVMDETRVLTLTILTARPCSPVRNDREGDRSFSSKGP